ncbi:MAG: cobalamin B12-binding domain-containing protein [Candidatus Hodarchaeales archaeon]|jgi:methylmalonyl-CoA mutase C-terminal domain/subunit
MERRPVDLNGIIIKVKKVTRKIRVLLAKPGLDGHDRGVKVVARALRDAGMEVIYTGLHKSSEQIVEAALQEDVDVIGLSSLSGAHMELFPRIIDLLKQNDMLNDTLVVTGGIIPDVDIPRLNEIGIEGIFGPGSDTIDIINFIKSNIKNSLQEKPL